MAVVKIKALFPNDIKIVWDVVTSLEKYQDRKSVV